MLIGLSIGIKIKIDFITFPLKFAFISFQCLLSKMNANIIFFQRFRVFFLSHTAQCCYEIGISRQSDYAQYVEGRQAKQDFIIRFLQQLE